jgi:hypothetical protein
MTKRSLRAVLPVAAAVVFLAGCEAKKSSNPLSPAIAGPIPGVEITQPKLLEPGQGWKYRERDLPLTLLVENASSNGPRPLVYAFDVAVDAGFQNVVFSRRDVPEGGNGRTALAMQDKLQLGRQYYWRAWAYDGANTGQTATTVSFEVFPPVSIHSPDQVSPANGSVVSELAPPLWVRNAARTGPAGPIRYNYLVARDQAFSQIVAAHAMPENASGQTVWNPPGLSFNTTYYWRVQATDGEVTSGWSPTWSFQIGGVPGPGPGGPGGPACGPPEPSTHLGVVTCERSRYGTPMASSQIATMLRAIAVSLNQKGLAGGPFGILVKTGGNNCGGYSCDIICSGQGGAQRQWDVLIDVEGAAAPSWFELSSSSIVVRPCEIQ